jgi:hypothetical protein
MQELKETTEFWIQYINVPIEVLADDELSSTDRLVFGLLMLFDHPTNHCFVSNKYLSLILKSSTQTISNSISKLNLLNYLKIKNPSNEHRVIKINKKFKINKNSLVKNLANSISAYKKIYNPPIKKFVHKIIKEDYNKPKGLYAGKKKILPPNKNPKKEKTTSSTPIKNSFYVNYYNTLPNIRKHKSGTKVYNNARLLLKNLSNGTFYKNKEFNETFFEKHNIPIEWAKKKWKKEEIKWGLRLLSDAFAEGCWAKNSNLDKNLPILIYNPSTKTSFFFMVLANEEISKTHASKIKDDTPWITDDFKRLCNSNGNGNDKLLVSGINSIKKYHAEIMSDDPHEKIRFRFRNINDFFREFTDFIKEQDWIEDLNIKAISAKSKLFSKFIVDVEDDLEMKLNEGEIR